MKDVKEYEKDLASIRSMMERSAKFISLSGLSGILAGIYALGGATAAYFLIHYPISPFSFRIYSISEPVILAKLLLIAFIVVVASLLTGLWLSGRKARKHGLTLWTSASKTLLFNVSIPMVTGGIFILIMLYTGHFGLAAPACLVFYGLALIQGSSNTVDEIRYLGYCEIILGLASAMYMGYGLIFWAIGFGVLHIVYGAIMHNKYDK
jgi:predicted lysophospholipase L1 biosynthesis ABC-type transport system permease subunit